MFPLILEEKIKDSSTFVDVAYDKYYRDLSSSYLIEWNVEHICLILVYMHYINMEYECNLISLHLTV